MELQTTRLTLVIYLIVCLFIYLFICVFCDTIWENSPLRAIIDFVILKKTELGYTGVCVCVGGCVGVGGRGVGLDKPTIVC